MDARLVSLQSQLDAISLALMGRTDGVEDLPYIARRVMQERERLSDFRVAVCDLLSGGWKPEEIVVQLEKLQSDWYAGDMLPEGAESEPISPHVRERVAAILKERGFPQYQ